ncbi:MAG: DUF502 domain-containing protein [Candidatus Hydrogenedentes bacterium]|nr:DUF502 domain-containing protein [Candidatus Hydrogenedentota bacterium]
MLGKLIRLLYNLILNRVLAGLVLIVPLGVTYYVVVFVYSILIVRITPLGNRFFEKVPPYFAPLVSILLIVLGIFALGFLTRLVIGKKIVSLIESVFEKIPVIKTIYGAVKKIVEVILRTSTDSLEKKFVVTIDFPFRGVKSIGIVTNKIHVEGMGECYTLFVPTVPNPTSGYFIIVPVDKVTSEIMATTEEVVSMLLSGGIVTPEAMRVSELGFSSDIRSGSK